MQRMQVSLCVCVFVCVSRVCVRLRACVKMES